jgi:hypothetical protein
MNPIAYVGKSATVANCFDGYELPEGLTEGEIVLICSKDVEKPICPSVRSSSPGAPYPHHIHSGNQCKMALTERILVEPASSPGRASGDLVAETQVTITPSNENHISDRWNRIP